MIWFSPCLPCQSIHHTVQKELNVFYFISDYSYANGDISSDKSDTGVFSPTSDSPFQPEFTPLTDNQVLSSDSNANVTAKFEDAPGRPAADSQGGFSPEVPVSKFVGDGSVPMTGITYSSDNSGVSGKL